MPCKHIDIRPQESDEPAFLFAVEGGAHGESPSRAFLLDGHLLGLWWYMAIIVTKPGIIIDVVGSYFYDKKS